MNVLAKAISVIALSMPLVACDTMGGFFGRSTPPPPPPPGAYQYPENYHGRNYHKPVYGRTSERATQPVAQQQQSQPQQQSPQPQQKKPDVTMVEQGNSSAPMPATTPKVNKGTEAPMVPGEAPSVE